MEETNFEINDIDTIDFNFINQNPFPEETEKFNESEFVNDDINVDLVIESQNKTFTINDVIKNGTNYISNEMINVSEWPNVFKFTARDKNENIIVNYDYAYVTNNDHYECAGNKWYLGIAQLPYAEIEKMQQNAKIEYIAMMSEVDLDD